MNQFMVIKSKLSRKNNAINAPYPELIYVIEIQLQQDLLEPKFADTPTLTEWHNSIKICKR